MCSMNARPSFLDPTLPLPNPGDWVSAEAAQKLLGVSHVTLFRMWSGPEPVLHRYSPDGAKWPMFWRPEVENLLAARTRAGVR